MFYDNFLSLCARKRESPSGVAKKIGLSNAAANGWKNGKRPSAVTLAKLSQYFGVPTGYLLSSDEKEKTPISPAFRRLLNEFESYDLSESDVDFILGAYKAYIENKF